MAFITENKQYFTNDGIPYVWGTGGISDPSLFSLDKLYVIQPSSGRTWFGATSPKISGGYILNTARLGETYRIYPSRTNYTLTSSEVNKTVARPDLVNGTNGLSSFFSPTSTAEGFYTLYASASNRRVFNWYTSFYGYDRFGNIISRTATNSLQIITKTFYHQGRLIFGTTGSKLAIVYPYSGNTTYTMKDRYRNDKYLTNISRSSRNIDIGNNRIVVSTGQSPSSYNTGRNYVQSVQVCDLNGDLLHTISDPQNDGYSKFGGSGWTSSTSSALTQSQGVAIGNGRIVVGAPNSNRSTSNISSGTGSVYIYDVYGNLIKTINRNDTAYQDAAESKGLSRIPTYSTTYGGSFGMYVAVGSGRIAVTSIYEQYTGKPNQRGATWLFDLNGNLIDILTIPDPDEGEPIQNNINNNGGAGLSVAIGSGLVAVGDPTSSRVTSNEGEVYLYSLDGNFISRLRHPTKEHTGYHSINGFFGFGIDVKDGLLAISSPGYNSNNGATWVYKVPKVYTAYDVIDFEQGAW